MRIIWFAIVACLTALPPLHAQVDLSAAPMARMQSAEIVILGEIHDNPAHHQGQARLIGQIAPRAVVFEMLSPAQADLFNTAPRTDLAALADQAYLYAVQEKIVTSRDQIARIAQKCGLTALPSAANFVAIDCGRDGAFAILEPDT